MGRDCGLWIAAAILLGIGLWLVLNGHLPAAAVFIGLGLPLAVIPPAYFFRARVTLENHVLVKLGKSLTEAAAIHFENAMRLQPENWTYKCQAWACMNPGSKPTEGYNRA